MRLLGIPFWEAHGRGHDIDYFYAQYRKLKCKLACWNDHVILTLYGRNMLAGSMVYSRFRHWAQCMVLPQQLIDALESDTQALIWAKIVQFDADEIGTDKQFRRSMKCQSQYLPRKLLGLGALDWKAHTAALQIRWMTRYLDASRGQWKQVLDYWFATRYAEGRGAVYTSIPVIKMISPPIEGNSSRLPKFWRAALRALRRLPVEHITEYKDMSSEEARAFPLLTNPLFKLRLAKSPLADAMRTDVSLHRVGDTLQFVGNRFIKETNGPTRTSASSSSAPTRDGREIALE